MTVAEAIQHLQAIQVDCGFFLKRDQYVALGLASSVLKALDPQQVETVNVLYSCINAE